MDSNNAVGTKTTNNTKNYRKIFPKHNEKTQKDNSADKNLNEIYWCHADK